VVRPASRRGALVLVVLLVVGVAACSDDDDSSATTTTTTDAPVGVDDDPALVPFVLEAGDLPGTFTPSADVDDTITSFCAGEDAAAGLRATGRALAGYRRDPAGASVIHVVFRFADDGADAFVRQAEAILGRCHEVPDVTGLAFSYEPVSPAVADALAGAEASASRYGTSFGSGSLTIDLAVFRRGDVGALVAVLGVGTPRDQLDSLAMAAFAAAVERLPG
jgi:hypothetical protein